MNRRSELYTGCLAALDRLVQARWLPFFLCFLYLGTTRLLAESFEGFFPSQDPVQSPPELLEEEIDFFALIPTAPQELEITNRGDVSYDIETEELVYRDQVEVLTDSGIQLFAQKAVISVEKKRLTLTGQVSVYNGPILFRGEKAVYYYEEKRLETEDLRTGSDPFLLKATSLKNIMRDGLPVLVADNAQVTTDDYANPSYWIEAKQVSLFPDQLAIFREMKVKIGGKTVLWLPYLAQSLDERLGYHFTPGGQSHLGVYWQNRYGLLLGGERDGQTGRVTNAPYELQLQLDLYSRRGAGLGAELSDLRYEPYDDLGLYSFYWIRDADPTILRTGTSRAGEVEKNRYRIEVKDRREWIEKPGEKLRLDTNLTLLSDRFFLEDYFEDDYVTQPTPDNLIALTYHRGRSLFNLNARLPVNDFFQTDRRYPEAVLSLMKTPFLGGNLFHEGSVRFGVLDEELAQQEQRQLRGEALTASPTRLSEIESLLEERSMLRFHTWQELTVPIRVGRGLSLTPRAGVGYTSYQGLGSNEREGSRVLFHAGLDASLKLSRLYPGVKNEGLGLNGLKHIIQPYATLSLLEVSSYGDELRPIDRLTPITRPRPLKIGRYSAIDDLADWSIFRLGLRNQFLTQREGESVAWLYWDSYMDLVLNRANSITRLSNLYSEISWNPLPWASLGLEAQFPITQTADTFTELFLHSTFSVSPRTELTVGYSFLQDHPQGVQDSNQISYEVLHRLNEEWSAGLEHRWQFDDHTLEYQRYAVHRSMKSWIFSAELFRRDFRVRQEWGVSVGFTLRDFPAISLPVSLKQ